MGLLESIGRANPVGLIQDYQKNESQLKTAEVQRGLLQSADRRAMETHAQDSALKEIEINKAKTAQAQQEKLMEQMRLPTTFDSQFGYIQQASPELYEEIKNDFVSAGVLDAETGMTSGEKIIMHLNANPQKLRNYTIKGINAIDQRISELNKAATGYYDSESGKFIPPDKNAPLVQKRIEALRRTQAAIASQVPELDKAIKGIGDKGNKIQLRQTVGDNEDEFVSDRVAQYQQENNGAVPPAGFEADARKEYKRAQAGERQAGKAAEKAAEKAANRIEKLSEKADSALKSIEVIKTGRDLVKQGIYTGSAANIKLSFDKWLQEAGITINGQTASNTDTFASLMGKQVGQVIKDFGSGTGLSDADREYAEKIAGGKITLTQDAIDKLLDINERLSIWDIQHHNQAVENYNKGIYFEKIPVPSSGSNKTSSGNRFEIVEE